IPMAAETGPIGGNLSHEFIILAETGESGVFCNRDVLDLPIPGEDVDYEKDLIPHIRPWTSLYAATEDVHDPVRFERDVPPEKRLHTRGRELGAKGLDVLYDDLDQGPGAKFATADLIGIPWQILVGPKGLAEGKVEVKKRADGSRELMTEGVAVKRLCG